LHLSHDLPAMDLGRRFAHAQLTCNLLVQQTSGHQCHHLALAAGQTVKSLPKPKQFRLLFTSGLVALTLAGTVDCVGVKEDALKAAQKVDDVISVVDHITVHAEDVTPRQIAEQARKEIVTYPFYTIFDNIVLNVEPDDTLIVSGQVSQPFKKGDIGNFLSHVKGVSNLRNDIEVLPTSTYDDELRLAIARAIYRDPFFVNYANQAIPPIHIIVKNGNVTLEGVVDSEVARAKAESDARFAATYFSLTNNLRVAG